MAKAGFYMDVKGINRTRKRKLNPKHVKEEIGVILETNTHQLAQKAASRAPVDTGRLRNSLLAYVYKRGPLHYEMTEGTEYTIYQEYRNTRGKQAFIRSSLYEQVEVLKSDLNRWKKKKR